MRADRADADPPAMSVARGLPDGAVKVEPGWRPRDGAVDGVPSERLLRRNGVGVPSERPGEGAIDGAPIERARPLMTCPMDAVRANRRRAGRYRAGSR
ncbi:hypothetical protein GCM10010464_16730 [Pseudonocardia yunnanensis]